MEGYLGEFPVDLSTTGFAKFTPADWAMRFIEQYGQIDGDHHKAWLLDQVARILKGTEVLVREARWENGSKEFRIRLNGTSAAYVEWVAHMEDNGQYDYDVGIAP